MKAMAFFFGIIFAMIALLALVLSVVYRRFDLLLIGGGTGLLSYLLIVEFIKLYRNDELFRR